MPLNEIRCGNCEATNEPCEKCQLRFNAMVAKEELKEIRNIIGNSPNALIEEIKILKKSAEEKERLSRQVNLSMIRKSELLNQNSKLYRALKEILPFVEEYYCDDADRLDQFRVALKVEF